ncbi:MtrB/PioB family decaheme-associated outer membrane protein [Shewanella avicenniae]|uniref:MtrB/PioB family decaheme-associated outer membrane protein n=1 Tax=Shewanella avicenniae TaxID=2814294 RepID=A0ABX7QQW2_9GAMM|nr:MtrB/PioB family decaheme-associated outer membrane protein [Shewanella avicenniae]QSX33852.1 MtrB/PioB family decaheme-associated outer membrane protein [Shewanella avicenniae]
MSMKLNLITLGLLMAAGQSAAADFGVTQANLSQVNISQYQCQRCQATTGMSGTLALGIGWNDSDDIRTGNRFGKDDAGWVGAVGGELQYRNNQGYSASASAHDLGLDNSSAHLESANAELYKFSADYQLLTHYQQRGRSPIWYSDNLLQPSATSMRSPSLFIERERIAADLAIYFGDIQAFAHFAHLNRIGNKSASLIAADGVVNFAQPVDDSTDTVAAGLSANGSDWYSRLQYNGSFFRNNLEDLSLPYRANVYAATPDNDAHQVLFDGQYLFGRTVVNGHVAAGRVVQEADLIPMDGNPWVNWNGEVDTRDARLNFSSLINARWRVNGQYSYSDRDNQGAAAEFAQLEWDNVNGAFRANIPLDIQRETYALQTQYRFNSQWHLSGNYQHKRTERNYLEREQNSEDQLWARLNIKPLNSMKIGIKALYETRDGSRYDASRILSPNENPLLRKYFLADRQRYGAELTFNHAPSDWLAIDVTATYAKDDYQHTDVGLTASEDYRYSANLSIDPSAALHLYATASQQWINSDMAGATTFGQANSFSRVEDRFINLGTGASYRWSSRLTLGADYLFANSESNTAIDSNDYDDYYDFEHSVEAYGQYALSDRLGLKLSYRYERYYDTDDAQVDVDAISGLTTLGKLEHNYNAHLLMLSVSYKLP